EAIATLEQKYLPNSAIAEPVRLPAHVSASIVIATCNRPDDLRQCLRYLEAQVSQRQVEIIVVDNNPASGLTAPVVSEFPAVILVNEPRRGANYARNAGIVVSTGDIIALIDDDVIMPPNWLENLIAPFSRADVMAATGNILPQELDTASQRYFEQFGDGGLGRGFKQFEFNGDSFEWSSMQAVPTWKLGGTANSAFRASIFCHPEIGLPNEMLGPGMPSGAGEDIYIFYKILKAGYTIFYEPTALVWHKHRRSVAGLQHQLYNYSKGIIAYHLTTFLCDRDVRGLRACLVGLPNWQLQRIKARLQRRCDDSIPMILNNILGNLAGPWSLWQSYRRVKRQGRSTPYIPVAQRQIAVSEPEVAAHQPATVGNSTVG
ncbi:MAG: glycosyltransferase, partial [Microcoleus sp. SIO2G3]|nr:glycosyltransferase [Microcoleus sp. SIO2G3]